MTNIKMKGSDILKQEITSHDEAVALMQQGSVLMIVGWWAKAKAIEYLVEESGMTLSKWHEENKHEFMQLNVRAVEACRQQAWKEVKWLDNNGVEENDLPKVENHAYKLRNVDDADKYNVWMDHVKANDKVPQWDKKPKSNGSPITIERVSKGDLFNKSKLLIAENQADLAKMIINYMQETPAKRQAIQVSLKQILL